MFRVGSKMSKKDLFSYFKPQEKIPPKDDEVRITGIVSSVTENVSHTELIFVEQELKKSCKSK